MRTSLVRGRFSGLRDSKRVSKVTPADVKKGNRARITGPVAVLADVRGRRSALALGRRRKPGHVASVGMPHSSKIYESSVFVDVQEAKLECLTFVSSSTSFLP